MAKIDWDQVSPKSITSEVLEKTPDTDFPNSYSGNSWRGAARILRALSNDPNAIRSLDPWELDERADTAIRGLGLTGFMVGWACTVLRLMYGATLGKSGAVIEVGKGAVEQRVVASPEDECRRAISGE